MEQSIDQRCNINMILESTSLIRGVVLNLIRDNTSLDIYHWSASWAYRHLDFEM